MRIFRANSTSGKSAVVPSTGFLVFLNGLLFFSTVVLGANLMGLILAIPMTAGFMLVSAFPHVLFRSALEKGRILAPIPRVAVYTSPFWGICALFLLMPAPAQKPNQKSPSISPSGKIQMTASAPPMGWTFKVETTDKKKSWDIPTTFASRFNVHWAWDAADRLWAYNSDDGAVMFWTNEDSYWKPHHWPANQPAGTDTPTDIQPPELLYPDYAKSNRS